MKALAVQRFLRSLGLPGVLALLGLLLAAALAWLGQGWERDAAASAAQADRLRAQLRLQRAAGPLSIEAAPATAAQWWQALPPASARQQRLADLLEMSLRLGLQSSRSEHRLSVDAATGLERLRVTMPLSGGYEQLRQYIEAALRHDPGLSLDGLKLRRTSPQAAELEAELQWSLHGRAESAAGSETR
ncbi:GspMb/PilO family protein [Roseateles sp.]|uniref:GspMb/PilO family protein n=1 Tax=Roseateles sp. TaxID=1971397 RepID=UPI003D0A32E8